MKKETEKIEVVRFETSYHDGTLDYYTDAVRSLCKAFAFNFKIIDQYLESSEVLRYYEIYIHRPTFLVEDLRHIVKTFILTHSMTFTYGRTIEVDSDEYMDMPTESFEEENLIRYKPKKNV